MRSAASLKAKFILLLFLVCLLSISFFTFAAESSSQVNLSVKFQEIINSPEFQKTIKRIYKINNTQSKPTSIEKEVEQDTGIPIGEEIILSLYIDKYYTSDLFAYKTQKNAQLSLINFFELIDFVIEVNVDAGKASGWFIKEQNDFTLELPEQEGELATVTVNGKQTVLSPENYYIFDDDIFVDADIIAQWFNFKFKFDFSALNMILISKTPLPLQLKLAREQKRVVNYTRAEAVLPWRESFYQPISSPLVDIQLSSTAYKERLNTVNYSILSSQNFAYLNSELFLSGDNKDSLSTLRAKFFKEDSDADLLGPLHATNYQFGDITPVKTVSSNTGSLGRGLRFSNGNKNNIDSRTKTFSGNIQPGWDIELYQNGLLINKAVSSEEGRYDFNDVPLRFGDNKFELVFYGPQGQVKKESEQIYVDKDALSAIHGTYAFSVVDTSKQLFNINDTSPGGGWLSTLTYKKGIADTMSVHSGVELFSGDEGDNRQTYSLGTDFSLFGNLLFGADFQIDNNKHKKTSLLARTQFAAQSFSFDFSKDDVFSLLAPGEVTSNENYGFAMSGSLLKERAIGLSYSNTLAQTKNSGLGTTTNSAVNNLALSTPMVYISNHLRWSESKSKTASNNELDGAISLRKQFGRLYSSLGANYSIRPESRIEGMSVELSLPVTGDIYSAFDFNYQPVDNSYQSELSTSFKFDKFNLQTRVAYDSDDDWLVGINSSFSFGYEPVTKRFFTSKQRLTQSGSLVARVFADDNLNGSFDEGEALVEGVKIKALQMNRRAITNEEGIAILTSLTNNIRTDVVIDKDSIADPFVIPATPGISITPRRGNVDIVDIPVVNAGELDGTVYLRDKQGNEKSGNYLTINLQNSEGEIVATTDTEFDGYYLFTDLLPGKYTLTIDAADIKRKNLHDAKVLEFDFSAAGDVIAGADFVVDRYTFVKGYVVDLGRFNSLAMLKTYWQIIKINYNNALQQQVFYTENQDEQTFHLNAAFFKGEAQAKRACKYLQEKGISCSVKEFEFNI